MPIIQDKIKELNFNLFKGKATRFFDCFYFSISIDNFNSGREGTIFINEA
jgi:hypothetical protein